MIKKYKDYIKPITIILLTNALLYFFIKTFITNYHIISPKINFKLIPEFSFIYNSWYPFIFIMAFVVYKNNKETFNHLILSTFIGIILSNITFIVYPTLLPRSDITVKSISDLLLSITYKIDTPALNCLPSVHCLLCFCIMFYITFKTNLKTKYKILINIYCILIILSTLFIRQHVIIDIVVAFIYIVISITITYLFYNKLKKALNFLF